MLTRPMARLIEENESLKRLEERMIIREGKSSETLRRYLEGVLSFTEFMKVENPDEALRVLKASEDITQKLDEYIDYLISKQFTPVNIKAHWHGVKKWLTVNRVNNVDWKYVSRPKVSTMIRDRCPSKEELRIILSNKVSLRDKAFFLTAACSGLRIGTLATLKVKDYRPIEDLGMITVEGAPNRKLPPGKSYFTFVTPEARKVLEDYLKSRGLPDQDKPLFAKENGQPLSPYVANITRQWRRLIKRANLAQKIENHKYYELHGHVLRKFFQTNAKLAGCRADFVDFWMGHHPTSPSQYLNDSYFRPSLEEHVKEYRKAVPYLTIFEQPSEAIKELQEELQRALKQKDEQIRKLQEAVVKPLIRSLEEQLEECEENQRFFEDPEYLKRLDGAIRKGWTKEEYIKEREEKIAYWKNKTSKIREEIRRLKRLIEE